MSTPPTNSPTNSPMNSPTNQSSNQNQPAQPAASGTFVPLHEVITDPSGNFVITNDQTLDTQGRVLTETTFTTTNPAVQFQVEQDLQQNVIVYNYETDEKTTALMNQIRGYANEIQCSDFHGKGTIDDYKILFQAASNIANESSQMTLDVDVSGFSEFGQAADQLSALFTSFITKLENVNIINDTAFLQTIANALQKIVNLSNVFGKFKDTIVATSTIRLPKSVVDTQNIMNNVMQEVNCAMNYMTYFVNPADTSLTAAALSDNDKSVITNAVQTITNWNTLCDQGVTVTMANDVHIKALAQTNVQLKAKTNILQSITSTLQSKLASYNL